MKLWLTSAEIADLALPGMPETKRNVNALAEREDWARFSALCRQRTGRGGGLEYHVNLLPVGARIAYFGAAAPAPTGGEALQAAPEPSPGTTGKAMQQLDARLAVLAAMKAFIRASELKQTLAISYFVDLYNLGKIDVPTWATQLLPRLATRTVLRWLSISREGESERLAVDKGASRRGHGVLDSAFDGEIKHFALAVHSFKRGDRAAQGMATSAEGEGMIHISNRALVRFVERTGLASFDGIRTHLSQSLERARASAAELDSDSFVVVADGLRYIVEDGVLVAVHDQRRPRKPRR